LLFFCRRLKRFFAIDNGSSGLCAKLLDDDDDDDAISNICSRETFISKVLEIVEELCTVEILDCPSSRGREASRPIRRRDKAGILVQSLSRKFQNGRQKPHHLHGRALWGGGKFKFWIFKYFRGFWDDDSSSSFAMLHFSYIMTISYLMDWTKRFQNHHIPQYWSLCLVALFLELQRFAYTRHLKCLAFITNICCALEES
jgi:hypothetical protein